MNGDKEDHKAIVSLAMMMGEVKKGIDNLETQVKEVRDEVIEHKEDYADGKVKAKEAHAETMAVVSEKMDRSEFVSKYHGVVKIQWLWDNWIIVGLIITILIGAGWLKYGDHFKAATDAAQQIKAATPGGRR